MSAALLFPLGIRLSTWIPVIIFLTLFARRGNGRVLLAGLAWLAGFETVFQTLSFLIGPLPAGHRGPIFLIAFGAVVVPVATRLGVRPDWRLLAAALALMGVWVATGFHVNEHVMVGFSPFAEALNEGVKTLWAAAYLVPLLSGMRMPLPGRPLARARAAS